MKDENNELIQADMTHEYNQAEAERTWPQVKEQIEEPLRQTIESQKKEIERLNKTISQLNNRIMGNSEY